MLVKSIGRMKKELSAFVALLGLAASASGVEWKMQVEDRDGGVSEIGGVCNPFARTSVELKETNGVWSVRIRNGETHLKVRSFSLLSAPRSVVDGRDRFYLPYHLGLRVSKWTNFRRGDGAKVFLLRNDGVAVLRPVNWRGEKPMFPSQMYPVQFMTLTDGEKGFYVATEDAKPYGKAPLFEYDTKSGRLRLGVEFALDVRGGETLELPPIVMSEYRGGYLDAARRFRRWWNSCHAFVKIAPEDRDMTGFMMVILKQQNDEIVWPYDEFGRLGEVLKSYGLDRCEFHGWGVGGHDKLYPEYDPDPAMGGTNGLVAGVKTLRDMGVHVSVYANGQLQQHGGTKWFERHGTASSVILRDGEPYQEYWEKYRGVSGRSFDVNCPGSPLWRERLKKVCRDAKAFGFDGFFYDQIGNQRPRQCYARNHDHRPGGWCYVEDRAKMMNEIRDMATAIDPRYVLWSEAPNETILDSVTYHTSIWYDYNAKSRYRMYSRFDPEAVTEMFPELLFAAFPELVMTDRCSSSLVSRSRANGTAVTNLRVDFEVRYRADRRYVESGIEPKADEYAALVSRPGEIGEMKAATWKRDRDYFRCVNEFRRTYRDILLRGTFRADEGFAVAGGEKIVANRWTGTNGEEGILVWNASDRPANVKVAFGRPLVACAEPERGEVAASDPIAANTLRLYRFK